MFSAGELMSKQFEGIYKANNLDPQTVRSYYNIEVLSNDSILGAQCDLKKLKFMIRISKPTVLNNPVSDFCEASIKKDEIIKLLIRIINNSKDFVFDELQLEADVTDALIASIRESSIRINCLKINASIIDEISIINLLEALKSNLTIERLTFFVLPSETKFSSRVLKFLHANLPLYKNLQKVTFPTDNGSDTTENRKFLFDYSNYVFLRENIYKDIASQKRLHLFKELPFFKAPLPTAISALKEEKEGCAQPRP